MEKWKDIKGYEGLYQVSNLGNVRSFYNYGGKGHLIKPKLTRGYLEVGLRKDGTKKYYLLHRLVAKAFIKNVNNEPCINHINEIKTDNRVENLEWCSYKYNINYGNRAKKYAISRGKRVEQYSLDGKYIKTFTSLGEASRLTNISLSGIWYVCTNQRYCKQAGGYIWKYQREGGDA